MMNLLSKLFIITTCTFFINNLFAQKLFNSIDKYAEIIDWEHEVSKATMKDALKKTGYKNYEYDIYTYLHKDYITIGDHDRVSIAIYDLEENWLETCLYSENLTRKKDKIFLKT